MKIGIGMSNDGEKIVTVKDYSDVIDKGQVAYFLAELEIIKLDLLELWEEYNE